MLFIPVPAMTIAVAGCSRELEPADRGSGPVRNTEVKTGGLLKKFRRHWPPAIGPESPGISGNGGD